MNKYRTSNILHRIKEEYFLDERNDVIEYICNIILKKYNANVSVPLNSVVGISGNIPRMTKDIRIVWNKQLLFDPSPLFDQSENFTGLKVYILSDLLKSRGYI